MVWHGTSLHFLQFNQFTLGTDHFDIYRFAMSWHNICDALMFHTTVLRIRQLLAKCQCHLWLDFFGIRVIYWMLPRLLIYQLLLQNKILRTGTCFSVLFHAIQSNPIKLERSELIKTRKKYIKIDTYFWWRVPSWKASGYLHWSCFRLLVYVFIKRCEYPKNWWRRNRMRKVCCLQSAKLCYHLISTYFYTTY